MSGSQMMIPCPHCAALNRVPREKVGLSPRCGRCHQPLFTAAPIDLGAAQFDRHASRGDLPLLVDFWAPWCGPCLGMAPSFASAAALLEPHMRLAKVDTEAEPALGGRFAIRSIPTLVLFSAGREVARQSGAMGGSQIVQWARSHLPSP